MSKTEPPVKLAVGAPAAFVLLLVERDSKAEIADDRLTFGVKVPLTLPGDGDALTGPAKSTLPLTKPSLWIESCPVGLPIPMLPLTVALLSWMCGTPVSEMTV